MELRKKTIVILIGAKGSGKTFIGQMMDQHLGIPFLRVEDIALQVKKERAIDNEAYITEVFKTIEGAVRTKLQTADNLVFESTGLTEAFDYMLINLKLDYNVKLISVVADSLRCLHRVKTRDLSAHVNVSDAQVLKINAEAARKNFDFDALIDNNSKSTEELLAEIKHILFTLDIHYSQQTPA